MSGEIPPGILPGASTPDPKDHRFTPDQPGSTKCRWCMFSRHAHLEVAPEAELHPKDQETKDG